MSEKDPITSYILRHQLASVMNDTKWRELAEVMTSHAEFNPGIRTKYLLDDEPLGFAHLDWEWIKRGEGRYIEWLDISPVRKDYVGRLVATKLVDFTEWVRASLTAHSIPFEEAEGIFRVRGYLRANTSQNS